MPRIFTLLALTAPIACSNAASDSSAGGSTGVASLTGSTGSTGIPGSTGELPTTGDSPTQGSMTTDTATSTGVDPSSTGTGESGTTSMVGTGTGETTTTTAAGETTSTTTGSTGPGCMCEPGSTGDCEPGGLSTCKADCSGFEAVPCPQGQSCFVDACVAKLCAPAEAICDGLNATKQCNAEGDGFDAPVPCGLTQECDQGACVELCEKIKSDPSSVGCVFRGNKMQNFIEEPSAVTVGNVSKSLSASVSMYYFQNGMEKLVSGPVNVAPGKSAQFDLVMPAQPGKVSVLRPDSTFKIVSNVPVVAYLHSPIKAEAHNDSSMLLPDHAQQKNYIIPAYTPNVGSNPAYFNVIGLQDDTEVSWTPPVATQAGGLVPAVAAGQTGKITIGDYDLLQVSSGQSDISGTIVSLSKPAWVVGAVTCVNIPANVTFCDHIEEQAIPLEYWGQVYVGAHAPKRGTENYWYRVYGGEDGVKVDTAPAQPGFPVVLNKGQFHEFKTKESFIFSASGPIMPVQYLEGQNGGAGTGDPASYQMVPVEQFLDRYVFVTGIGYNLHYVQVVRDKGGADIKVDGAVVNGYYTIGNYEVADWKISEGTHLAESDASFGIYQVGYTGVTSYAYPGGLRLKVINPQ
ncbi:MAG: hypothetical protein H0T76_03480 [Nannocystis sp.]|nr:hypothetical protein [Nannocystis sp.]MBA3545524.1 hypothetical protein [Nannocystis sp.]